MLRRSVPSAVVVLALTVGLGGCTAGDAEDEPTPAPTMSAPPLGEELTESTFVAAITTAQAESRTSRVDMTLGFGGQTIRIGGDVALGEADTETLMALQASTDAGGPASQLRLVDGIFYLEAGTSTQGKFARLDLAAATDPATQLYAVIVEQLDPRRQIETFASSVRSFAPQGEPVPIDGVEAQPYVVTVDSAKVEGLDDVAGGASVPPTVDYTIYVGPDNLPRRLSTDALGTSIDIEYSRWGEPVDIAAPSADDLLN